jgi:hypothetical protein
MSWITLLIVVLASLALASLAVWLLRPLSEVLLWLAGQDDDDLAMNADELRTRSDELPAR